LALFLFGALAHQILWPFYKKIMAKNIEKFSIYATWFLIAFCAIYFLIPITNENTKSLILIIIFLALIPLTFFYQNLSSTDKWVGELSYPIYILHMLVIWVLASFRVNFGDINQLSFSLICVAFTILFSIVINK